MLESTGNNRSENFVHNSNSDDSLEPRIYSGLSGIFSALENSSTLQKDCLLPPLNICEPSRAESSTFVGRVAKGSDGMTILFAKDLEHLGPKTAELMKENGVERVMIDHDADNLLLQIKLEKPLERTMDPWQHNCKKFVVDTDLKFGIKKEKDDAIVLKDIEGMKAIAQVFGQDVSINLERIRLSKTNDGRTKVESDSHLGGGSLSKISYAPAEVFEKANLIIKEFQKQ